MRNRLTSQAMYASLRTYLQDIEESGIDGFPIDEQPARTAMPACQEQSAATAPASPLPHAPQTLDEVRQLLGDCRRCELAASRANLVFGAGSPKAQLLFVGEAPGADEDRQGEPFVGEAGAILTRIISAMGLTREQVYICNTLKCRPPANRNPHRDEINACAPFLQQQIRVISPKVIVALGTFAAQTLLHSKEPISKLRGRFHDLHGIPVMPTFHPSFLLRNKDNKQHYWDVWEDMTLVLKKLHLPVPDKKKQGR